MARNKSKKNKKNNSQDAWFEAAERTPRVEAVDLSATRKSVKRWRAAVWAIMAMSVLLVLSTAVLLFDDPEPEIAASQVDAAQPGMQEARLTVGSWLAGEQSPLPGGRIVSWNGATMTPFDGEDAPAYKVFVHDFTLASADGTSTYTAQVRTAASDVDGVNVLGQPSLIPVAPSLQFADGDTWPGLVSTPTGEGVTDAVNSWVNAYTSGDSVALRLAVGDPDAQHGYMPLFGITSAKARILEVAQPAANDGTDADGTQVVAGVTVTFSRTGDVADDRAAAQFDLDVLIMDADTASPRVVAWSGPGEGHLLTEYVNAVDNDRVSRTAPDADSNPAGTASPSPSAAPVEAAPAPDPEPEKDAAAEDVDKSKDGDK